MRHLNPLGHQQPAELPAGHTRVLPRLLRSCVPLMRNNGLARNFQVFAVQQ